VSRERTRDICSDLFILKDREKETQYLFLLVARKPTYLCHDLWDYRPIRANVGLGLIASGTQREAIFDSRVAAL
jgi:hypothetical protein